MARKKKPNEYYQFESLSKLSQDKNGAWKHKYDDGHGHQQTDTACYICYSMMTSEAYTDLTPRQQQLYTVAKMQFYGARSRPSSDYDVEEFAFLKEYNKCGCFYLNHFLLTKVFKLYTATNYKAIYEDINALVSHGFIERMTNTDRSSAEVNPGKRTIYRYSDAWKKWGKKATEAPTSQGKQEGVETSTKDADKAQKPTAESTQETAEQTEGKSV